jgi:transcriptional regulator with XRE-family HTH domain
MFLVVNDRKGGDILMMDMEDIEVGLRIRMLRQRKGLSLRDLAELSGLSTNAISRIERGVNSPTVASLRRLATGLGVSVVDIFKDETEKITSFVKEEHRSRTQAVGALIESLGIGLPDQNIEPFIFTVDPGVGSTTDLCAHPGEEFVFCIEGAIEYRVGNQIYQLSPGDSLLFKADQPHCFRNPSQAPAKFLLVLQEHEKEGRRLAREAHMEI